MKLLDCAFIGICVVIKLNMVFLNLTSAFDLTGNAPKIILEWQFDLDLYFLLSPPVLSV